MWGHCKQIDEGPDSYSDLDTDSDESTLRFSGVSDNTITPPLELGNEDDSNGSADTFVFSEWEDPDR